MAGKKPDKKQKKTLLTSEDETQLPYQIFRRQAIHVPGREDRQSLWQ
jgi:hypothetical protein